MTTTAQPQAVRPTPIGAIPFSRLVNVEFRKSWDTRAGFWLLFSIGAIVLVAELIAAIVTGVNDVDDVNFGTFATPERNVVFDINDFDETERGPWEWDVKRLATSLHVVAREHGFRASERDDVVLEAVRVYREYVDQYAGMRTLDVWYDRTTADDLVAHFPKRYRAQAQRDVTRALRKDHVRAVARLTEDRDGRPVTRADQATPGLAVNIVFADDTKVAATIDGGAPKAEAKPETSAEPKPEKKAAPRKPRVVPVQGSLF